MSAPDTPLVDGKTRTVKEMLSERKYGLDFYQREYTWTETNVAELVTDLTGAFLNEYRPEHTRRDVAGYRSYFLGPVVTSVVEGTRLLVDGQQRLTTLTLLLIQLAKLSEGRPGADSLAPLIHSTQYGEKSFNIDVQDRNAVMRAIVDGTNYTPDANHTSARNLLDRYQTITDQLPDEITGAALLHFIDWLRERVVLVEIVATDQDMALEIFETMNDRGLQLSSTDMLKSYLIARIEDDEVIARANKLWRQRVEQLTEIEKHADSDFIKTWLRAKYATTIRERNRGASPEDFDKIGTAFHKWARDNHESLGLHTKDDFRALVEVDFDRLSARYLQLLSASSALTPGLEAVFYNAHNGISLQYLPMLAAVTADDDDATFESKARLIANYWDLVAARRMVNFQNYGYSPMYYGNFVLTKELRGLSIDEVQSVLADRVAGLDRDFSGVERFSLTQRNRNQVAYLLARMTDYVSGAGGTWFAHFAASQGKQRYEVEHIWANHPDQHSEDFTDPRDFADTRNRFGGLLLLPKDFNASYNDKTYAEKLPHYYSQSILAKSLNPRAYIHEPAFTHFIASSRLPFKSYPDSFTKKDLDERQHLYRLICEQIWEPQRLGLGGGTAPGRARDYYVCLAQDGHRDWQDARRYGFISAGGGRRYSQSLRRLKEGDRVFAYIPQHGYVGVGEVTSESRAAADMTAEISGETRSLPHLPLRATLMFADDADDDLREHAVAVNWSATRDLSDAVRFENMFTNQNIVCQLRPEHGIDSLLKAFGLKPPPPT